MKRAVIFLNGNAPDASLLAQIKDDDLTVVADGAMRYVKGHFIPDVLVGDYDSLGFFPKGNEAKEVLTFPCEKDFTDGSIAVKLAVERGANQLVILGALGGRADHFYANLSLLHYAESLGATAEIIDENTKIRLISGKTKACVGKNSIVSIVPFFDSVHILSTKGLKYSADGITLTKLRSDLGVSNQAIEDVIEIETDGKALLFITENEENKQ